MTPVVRTSPIRLSPLAGEALDSWLEALAHRMHVRYGDVLHGLGLASRTRGSKRVQGIPTDWTIGLTNREAADIAYTTGVDQQRVHAMTLAHFDGRALLLEHAKRKVNQRLLWGRTAGSRYCPDCLVESAGRWQLEWRLGWSFACIRHRRLLADTCPSCGSIPRARPFSRHSVPAPGYCATRPPLRESPATVPGCAQDLRRVQTLQLREGHPALAAQRLLSHTIETGSADFGLYARLPQPSAVALADLRAVSGRILTNLNTAELSQWVPRDILDACLAPTPGSDLHQRALIRPGAMAPATAARTAAAVVGAVRVLGDEDLGRAAADLRTLLTADRGMSEKPNATTTAAWGRGIGPVLRSAQLAALGPSLRSSDQLRFRTLTIPADPAVGMKQIKRRSRGLSSALWPSWVVRLCPREGVEPHALAPALAAMVLLVGSRIEFDSAEATLGSVGGNRTISYVLGRLREKCCWEPVATAVVRLADYLDEHEVPIDYQRRRRLDYTAVLPTGRWTDICHHLDQRPGGERRLRVARSVLFSRISGMPIERAPDFLPGRGIGFYADTQRFTEKWTPELAECLEQAAREFLISRGVQTEPVVWHPPLNLLDGLDLPGADPADIDIERLHRLTRERRFAAGDAAKALGTSIEAVRVALSEHPAQAAQLTPAQARTRGLPLPAARQVLTDRELRRRYLDDHQSANAIARDVDLTRGTVLRLAMDYGIEPRTSPKGSKRRKPVDRDWLFEQYVTNRRTLRELACESGMSPSTLARWARELGIPLRRRGGTHAQVIHANGRTRKVPTLLQPLLYGRIATNRLRRFADASKYRSLRKAAAALGTTQSTLSAEIAQLERDLGEQILIRATHRTPIRVTAAGSAVIAAFRRFDRRSRA